MRLYEELETGVECERLAPTLHALAKGTADSEALLELRPHLRNCAGCRATVRALHTSHLRGLSAIAAAVIAPARAFVERLSGRGAGGRASDAPVELHPMEHQQDVDELLRRLNGGESAVQPVAPSVAEGVGRLSTVRINLRGWAETALHRLQSSDLAIGVHAASTGGGGRITSIAALIGICVSGVGAGTYCVATALLPDPKPAIRSEAETAKRKTPLGRRVSKTNTLSSAPRAPSSVQPGGVSGSRFTVAQTPKTVPKRTTREKTVRPDEFSFETDTRPSGSQPTPPVSAGSAAAGQTTSTGGFESGSTTGGATSGGEFDDGTGGEFSP